MDVHLKNLSFWWNYRKIKTRNECHKYYMLMNNSNNKRN